MKKHLTLILITITLAITFYPSFAWMFGRFNELDSYYSHGYIIPFVTAFLLWRKREMLVKAPVLPCNAGLALIIAGLLLHITGGIIFKIGFISGFSFIVVFFGISLYLFGKEITKISAFPMLFLLLMVPLPKVLLLGITFKMKMAAAQIAVAAVSAMHIAVERQGSLVYLPNGVLTVGNECSGINSLISMFTLSLLFGYLVEKSVMKRSLFALVSLPIALTANISRIIFLIVAAYIYGIEAVNNGLLHYGSGIVLWLAALLMLTFLWSLMKPQTADQSVLKQPACRGKNAQ